MRGSLFLSATLYYLYDNYTLEDSRVGLCDVLCDVVAI